MVLIRRSFSPLTLSSLARPCISPCTFCSCEVTFPRSHRIEILEHEQSELFLLFSRKTPSFRKTLDICLENRKGIFVKWQFPFFATANVLISSHLNFLKHFYLLPVHSFVEWSSYSSFGFALTVLNPSVMINELSVLWSSEKCCSQYRRRSSRFQFTILLFCKQQNLLILPFIFCMF